MLPRLLLSCMAVVMVAGCSVASADNTPNENRSYKLTVINGFDKDAVDDCSKNDGRLFISQYSSVEPFEAGAWICVTGNLVYPFVGEPIVIVDHVPDAAGDREAK